MAKRNDEHALAITHVTIHVDRTEVSGNEWGGKTMRRVPDGTLSGMVELRIDLDGLTQVLGRRALRSKGKRARMAEGLIQAVVQRSTLKRGI